MLDGIDELPDPAWVDIGLDKETTAMRHRPAGWEAEQSYVVVRRVREGGQGQLFPAYTVILVSRDDLPVDELVRRQAGPRERVQGAADRSGPASSAVPAVPANQAFYVCSKLAQLLLCAGQYGRLLVAARAHGLRR